MLEGVNKCSEYIFFILDDYFLSDYWEEDLFKEYITNIKKYNINCLQISPSDFQTYSTELDCPYLQILDSSEYIISMQPSIWRKSYLQKVLLSHYSPWDFEVAGSLDLKVNGDPHTQKKWRVYRDNNAPKRYFNAVRRGFKKSSGWLEFKEKEKLNDF